MSHAMSYTNWMIAVDAHLIRAIGLTSDDLPDACTYDWWADEITPKQAARLLIEAGP